MVGILQKFKTKRKAAMGIQAVKGRFAPTPSGRMHAGNILSALLAWLSVRSQNAVMVLRIEDLDPRAHNRSCAQQLIEDLAWLGLDWDEGPFWQSERKDLYDEAIEKLMEAGLLYPCFCTRSELHAACAPHASDGSFVYQGNCKYLCAEEITERSKVRSAALRLTVPQASDPRGVITYTDELWGTHTEVLEKDCGDFLVKRSDGIIAYQLAVVVDDALMGISEVVRGRDLLSSCGRQMYLQHLLGYPTPTYYHAPLLISPSGRRLSKRDRDLDISQLKARYGRPEPIIGALAAALGLAEQEAELMPRDLIESFSWDVIRKKKADLVANERFLH